MSKSKSFGLTVHFGDLKKFQKNFDKVFGKDGDCGQYIKEILNTSASRCIYATEGRTPKDTGQLRKNWKAKPAIKAGWDYRVTVENDVEYATYVEYGHRTRTGDKKDRLKGIPIPPDARRNKESKDRLRKSRKTGEPMRNKDGTGWVKGYFMLTKSIRETKKNMPKVADEVLTKKLLELTK
jgi:hypothetical protein